MLPRVRLTTDNCLTSFRRIFVVSCHGHLCREMRETAELSRSAVSGGCRCCCQDVDRFLAGYERVHEPALQQWPVLAGLCEERRGALPQGMTKINCRMLF